MRTAIVCIAMLFAMCEPAKLSANSKRNNQKETFNEQKETDMKYRGVVYDVGLQFGPGPLSVEQFSPDQVRYDMQAIAKQLNANAVRIEGEVISRLVFAAEAAHAAGLRVLFNPWKMNADVEETIAYMADAAVAAEKLRKKGVDIVFVAGCEYTIFSKGVFPGDTFNERVMFMVTNGGAPMHGEQQATAAFGETSKKLNEILGRICVAVRANFKGLVTYSSGTWEDVDWELFDIVGIDYYRRGESAEEYVQNLEKYKLRKPLIVMEVGSCAYEGAAQKGDGGFAVLQGTNPDGTGIYLGGEVPVRNENEQADYVETQVKLLSNAEVNGVFVYVFAFPIMPYAGEGNKDLDMTSFSLVTSFPKDDPRSKRMPSWEKKAAFDRLGQVYGELRKEEE